MSNYKIKTYITQEDFRNRNREGEGYTGFVIGLGYAFEEEIPIYSARNFTGAGIWHGSTSIQRFDHTPEAYIRSLNINEQQIKEIITHQDSDGRYVVNMGGASPIKKSYHVDSLDDIEVVIKDENGTLMLGVKVSICKKGITSQELLIIPLKDFTTYYNNDQFNELLFSVDAANSMIGVPIGWLESKWEIHSDANRRFRRDLAKELTTSLRRNGHKVKASELRDKVLPKALRRINRMNNIIGGACIITGIVVNRRFCVSDLFVSAVFGASLIPGIGWAIGGGFFAADIVSLIISDKSIGDHLNGMFDNGGVIWQENPLVPDLDDLVPFNYRKYHLEMDELIAPRDNTRVTLPRYLY